MTAALRVALIACAALGAPLAGAADRGDDDGGVLVTVGDEVITVEEFRAHLHAGAQRRYFHGRIQEEQLADLRRVVAQSLVDRILLRREAERRGLRPDEAWVEEGLARHRRHYPESAGLANLRKELESDSLVRRLREQIEARPRPPDAEVRRYYELHPDKFTTPERVRVAMILLKVEPWAPAASWQAADGEAERLVEKLRGGADFGELARLHSGDASAARGGDLGYVHRGMLAEEIQRELDGMKPGEISGPVRMLQGVAILRFDGRIAPVLNPYPEVEDRARGLLLRERRAQDWEQLLAALRRAASIELDEALLSAIE